MTDVAAHIEDEFGARIRACERLYEYAKGLTKSWPGRPLEDTADGLIAALFGRSLDTFKAAITLASQGYGAQAAMLNRSLFEDMVDAHWVATDPDAATQRYSDHHDHGRMLLADAVRKYPEHYADIKLPEFDEAERKRLDDLYTRWGSKPWSGINLHTRVGLVEHHWKDEASRNTLWFFHDIAHRENNQTLHVSAASLNANVRLSEDSETLSFHVGPRPDMIDRALFGAFWIFDATIGLVHERFGIELDDNTRAEVFTSRDFVTLTDEQMRKTGRNDPCPCGSGQKFKKCHGITV
jgi:hypothetical protein